MGEVKIVIGGGRAGRGGGGGCGGGGMKREAVAGQVVDDINQIIIKDLLLFVFAPRHTLRFT